MDVLPNSDGAGLRAVARRGFRRSRDFVDEMPPDTLVTVTVTAVSLLVALTGFLAVSSLTTIPFAVFLVATGYDWLRHQELTARVLMLTTTISTILVLGLILVFIFAEAWPTVQYATVNVFGVPIPGLRLFIETRWSPVTPPIQYSFVPMIHGTVLVTIIATVATAPLGVAAVLFLSEITPRTVREFVRPGVEILAGIPSIVYGFTGSTTPSPWTADQLDIIGQGTYLFVGIVVGLMALPTVVSVIKDALNSIPESMKSGSLTLGTTDWQTMTSTTLPAAFSGASAAVLLGVGRVIGKTMAATMMLRGSPGLTKPLCNVFYGSATFTPLTAANYGDADDLQLSALFVAGVILFVTVLSLSIGLQCIEARMCRKLGGAE